MGLLYAESVDIEDALSEFLVFLSDTLDIYAWYCQNWL